MKDSEPSMTAIRVASRPYAKDGALELPAPCVIASGRKP